MKLTRASAKIDIKILNKQRIYRRMLEEEKTSQQRIANSLRLSIPTVLQNIKELISEGLAAESGVFDSTGGRKARAFSPLARARVAMGVDITKNHVSIVAVDLAGRIFEHERIYNPYANDEDYRQRLGEYICGYIRRKDIPEKSILGVGFSIPGIVDEAGERITFSHVLGFMDMPCADFSRHVPYPCVFINDANAGGIAELRGRPEVTNAVYLSLSNSVGGSVIQNGELYCGDNMRSGEFGHMTLIPGGRECHCGKRGCVDVYVSARVLAEHTHGEIHTFFAELERKNPACQAAFQEYLEHLSMVVNNLYMCFDCDVIIGGYVGRHMEPYHALLREKLARLNSFDKDARYAKVCRYQFEAAALGAALLPIEEFLENIE